MYCLTQGSCKDAARPDIDLQGADRMVRVSDVPHWTKSAGSTPGIFFHKPWEPVQRINLVYAFHRDTPQANADLRKQSTLHTFHPPPPRSSNPYLSLSLSSSLSLCLHPSSWGSARDTLSDGCSLVLLSVRKLRLWFKGLASCALKVRLHLIHQTLDILAGEMEEWSVQ